MSRFLAALLLIAAPAAAQPPPELLFQAEAQTLSGSCNGEPVRLEGNHNTVVLKGPCGSLLLKGVANTLTMGVRSGGTIHVEGSANRIRYTTSSAPPLVEVLGPDNEVTADAASVPHAPAPVVPPAPRAALAPPASPVAAAVPAKPSQATGPLLIANDDVQRLAECGGKDVAITGNRSAVVLRGGCKSLTLTGDLLAVQADLVPGAKVTVTGRGSIVTYTLKARGKAPVTLVRGEGSRVQRAEP